MDNQSLEDQLNGIISKQYVNLIADSIGYNPELYVELWEIAKRDEYKISVLAGWVMDILDIKYPQISEPLISELVEFLPDFTITGIRRFFLKILSKKNIPEYISGKLFNLCYNFIEDANETVAVKVHSMQILYNISQNEPDLKPEIAQLIEYHFDNNSMAYKSRATKILSKLQKEIK